MIRPRASSSWGLVLAIVSCSALCSPAFAQHFAAEQPPPTPQAVDLTGQLSVSRATRGKRVVFVDTTGKRWLLTGNLVAELANLHGHKAHIKGKTGPEKMALPTIDVDQYDLPATPPKVKLIGRLRRQSSGLMLVTSTASVKLIASAALRSRLTKSLNCKIWIGGRKRAAAVKVSRFGRLACGSPPAVKPKDGPTKEK